MSLSQNDGEVYALYKDIGNPDNSRHLQTLAALAFMLVSHNETAYSTITFQKFLADKEKFSVLLDYFEKTLLVRETRRGYSAPQCAASTWCQVSSVLNNVLTTNNNHEGWYNSFLTRLGCDNPTIWKFIDVFQQEHGLVALNATQNTAGTQPEKPRKKYSEANE